MKRMPMRESDRDRYLAKTAAVIEGVAKSSRVLDAIAWPRSVERAFFAAHARKLPEPVYEVDRARATDSIAALCQLEKELAGEHPLLDWLRAVCQSYVDANRMLLALGTRDFYALSLGLYGGAKTTALDHDTNNLDFAQHIASRLGVSAARHHESHVLTTDEFIAEIEAKLARRRVKIEIDVVKDEDLSAKVICGMTRMRVRDGATFSLAEANSLFFHEIETHALTAQNGDAQERLPFLRGGGPRTTRTQEGLAVFAELYAHALSTERLRRLVERVRLVDMAEQGASFLELYREILAHGGSTHDAYLDAQRICRGGLVSGGAPFTKDASYLSGLIEVYNFLRVALRSGAHDVAEVLVSGRIALEDVGALMWLRAQGVLAAPRLIPRWLAKWDGLLAYFAFTSFLNEVELGPIQDRHRALLARAKDAATS